MADSVPGFRAIFESEEAQIWYNGPDNNHQRIEAKATIDNSTVDAANSPTTTLRAGLVLGLKASDAKCYQYDADATDGTNAVVGVLPKYLSMLDQYRGETEDKMSQILIGGVLKSISTLIGIDKAAAAVLLRRGFHVSDLEPHGSAFGFHPKARYFKAADYTLLDADHGCMFVAVTGAVNFTLPSLATVGKGYQVLLYNAVDANMTVTAAANTLLIGDAGGAASTTITFSTATEKMGGQALLYSDYASDGGSLAWYVLFTARTYTTA